MTIDTAISTRLRAHARNAIGEGRRRPAAAMQEAADRIDAMAAAFQFIDGAITHFNGRDPAALIAAIRRISAAGHLQDGMSRS